MTMQLIETKTLVSTSASVDFTSIPQDGTDLVLLLSLRENGGDTHRAFLFSINGTEVSTHRALVGNGASASSLTAYIGVTNSSTSTSNTFANCSIYIPNYAVAGVAKSISTDTVSEANATTAFQVISASLTSTTTAVTSLSVIAASTTWQAGTMVSLYKITKGSGGATVS